MDSLSGKDLQNRMATQHLSLATKDPRVLIQGLRLATQGPRVPMQDPNLATQSHQEDMQVLVQVAFLSKISQHIIIQIDQILVHQQIELLEVLTGFETNNKYEIKNSLGQRVYFAVEDTDCCTRNCCGAARPFTLRILDNLGQEVMTLERPLRCSSCCFPCCLQEVEIQAPPGVPVGYVTQTWHPCLPKFTLQNEKKQDVLKVVGPCVVCTCCSDIDFELKSLDEGSVVGKISKQWSGLVREAFTDADNFGIQFPLDLDVKMKAVMLGACFLIRGLESRASVEDSLLNNNGKGPMSVEVINLDLIWETCTVYEKEKSVAIWRDAPSIPTSSKRTGSLYVTVPAVLELTL
ncbi:hypothetical protein STEG23_016888 [Scotinomys teguina]